MTPEALIFDVFGTVVDWRSGVAREAAAAFAARGIDADPHAFADAWRAEYQPAMERVRSGARGYVPLDDLHLENLGRVLDRLGLGEHFDEAGRLALNAAWEKLPPWPDVAEGLAQIARRALIAPCSNGSLALMARLARFAGLPWHVVLGADIARAYKPDPAVYRAAAAALRLEPGAVMMVAAHEDDLAAARAAGLRTAFVPRPHEFGPGRAAHGRAGAWDLVAEDFPALAARLAEISG